MKKALVFLSLLLFSIAAFSEENPQSFTDNESIKFSIDNSLPKNYQQFQQSLLNLDLQNKKFPKHNLRRGNDYTMLYVAGGVAVLTTALAILTANNGYEEGLGQASTGIIIGGGVMTSLIATKYFVDEYRR